VAGAEPHDVTSPGRGLGPQRSSGMSIPIENNIPLIMPADSCCNCGSMDNIREILTDLRRVPYLGFARVEVKLALPFPYCEACASTARRLPLLDVRSLNARSIIAICVCVGLALGLSWPYLPTEVSEQPMFLVAPIVLFLSVVITLEFYARRRRTGSQTSVYQPVRLKNTIHKWPADIIGIELEFTNKQYGEKFAAANQAAIRAKKLRISAT
jgi:hypothetical protein